MDPQLRNASTHTCILAQGSPDRTNTSVFSKPCKNGKILSLPLPPKKKKHKPTCGEGSVRNGWMMDTYDTCFDAPVWIWHLHQSQSGKPLANPTLSWKVFQVRLHAEGFFKRIKNNHLSAFFTFPPSSHDPATQTL